MPDSEFLHQHTNGSPKSNTVLPPAKQSDRLARLEGYLSDDPLNESLLAEAHEAAVYVGAFDKARLFQQRGFELTGHSLNWRLREAAALAAEGRYRDAESILQELKSGRGVSLVISHELASMGLSEFLCVRLIEPSPIS